MTTYRGKALEALGDPTRRAIFERLAKGPRSVGDLASGLPVSRPAVSQHLKVLKDARLVRARARGTRHLYELDRDGLARVREYFDRFWSQALASFAKAVEEKEEGS